VQEEIEEAVEKAKKEKGKGNYKSSKEPSSSTAPFADDSNLPPAEPTFADSEKLKADEAAEDLEELQREIDLIKEEKRVMEAIEEKGKKREEELSLMRVQLAEIMTNIELYNIKVGDITDQMRELEEARREEALNAGDESFVDNIEVLQAEDDRRQEELRSKEDVEAIAENVRKGLIKVETLAGKTDSKVAKAQAKGAA